MAQRLRLDQRAEMVNKLSFLNRLAAAIKGTADYWKNYNVDTFEKYNVGVKKRKEYAKQVLGNASVPNLQAYAEYLVYNYTYDGEPEIENGELVDSVLSDSTTSANSFDYFAGVKQGDETKQIEL